MTGKRGARVERRQTKEMKTWRGAARKISRRRRVLFCFFGKREGLGKRRAGSPPRPGRFRFRRAENGPRLPARPRGRRRRGPGLHNQLRPVGASPPSRLDKLGNEKKEFQMDGYGDSSFGSYTHLSPRRPLGSRTRGLAGFRR